MFIPKCSLSINRLESLKIHFILYRSTSGVKVAQTQNRPRSLYPLFTDFIFDLSVEGTGSPPSYLLPLPLPPSADCDCLQTVRGERARFPLRHPRVCSSSTMEGNDDSDIIEHHVEEDMEKKEPRSHAASSSFLDSVTPSARDAPSGTQSSHRLLAYSDALISIIATVMVIYRAEANTTLVTPTNMSLCLLLFTFTDITCCSHKDGRHWGKRM